MVDVKTLMGREIAHKFNTWWKVGTVRCLEKNVEFAVFYESDQQPYKRELSKTDYGAHKYLAQCFFQKT